MVAGREPAILKEGVTTVTSGRLGIRFHYIRA
jgi:hypothetical protein